ncbi:MAG: hypothetical protein ABSG04_08400, partial [Verrucomicrobiota bacterium]
HILGHLISISGKRNLIITTVGDRAWVAETIAAGTACRESANGRSRFTGLMLTAPILEEQ